MKTTGERIMSNVTLTTEQSNCIKHEKGNLIVSAAAGSGKTQSRPQCPRHNRRRRARCPHCRR